MPSISGVVIAHNEEAKLGRCLASLAQVCDELIVVDSGSTDGTESIARWHDARFLHQDFLGFVEQKNYASRQARGEYILSLDADEYLSDELITEIKSLAMTSDTAYSMPRRNIYIDRWIKYGGWYPDRKLRLWPRDSGVWTGDRLHEVVTLDIGISTVQLQGDIVHHTVDSVAQHLDQVERFSSIAAAAAVARGDHASIGWLYLKPVAKFITQYFFKLGVLDGRYGWLIARHSAYGRYLRIQHMRDHYQARD